MRRVYDDDDDDDDGGGDDGFFGQNREYHSHLYFQVFLAPLC